MLDVHGPVDQWSDTPDIDDDQSLGDNQGDLEESTPLPDTEESTVRGIKVATAAPKTGDATVMDSTVCNAPPAQPGQGHSSTANVQGLPVVHVTAGQSPPARPPAVRSPQPSDSVSAHSEIATHADGMRDREVRRRSGLEGVRSPNRISGFFSNLIHRRDTITPATARTTPREERAATPGQSQSEPESRAQSPAPVRPVTPPPPLAPPSLHELGLSLTAITSDLSPSHFSTSPTNGAFLGPRYLLLCHAQGLDVLPLVSPPVIQPYALVRRVPFKSVVVMEHRGVLVAIAGRRDGVRVYALEEVKKAVEWRIDLEIRRERERTRKEESRRIGSTSSSIDQRDSLEKKGKLSTSPVAEARRNINPTSRPSSSIVVAAKKPRPPTTQPLPPLRLIEQPPPYTSASDARPTLPRERSAVSVNISRSRQSSISLVVVPPVPPPVPSMQNMGSNASPDRHQSKSLDWLEGSSDDEAIDLLTAGPSGSQALDERTSSIPATRSEDGVRDGLATLPIRSHAMQSGRANRPANLDLALPPATNSVPAYVPSPSPTLLTIRQALHSSPQSSRVPQTRDRSNRPEVDPDDEDDDDIATVPGERITFAQALLESRLPNLPPAGTLQPQEPIFLVTSPVTSGGENSSPLTPSFTNTHPPHVDSVASRSARRRRWSVLGNIFASHSFQSMGPSPSAPAVLDSPLGSPISLASPSVPEGRPLVRSLSNRSRPSPAPTTLAPRPSTSGGARSPPSGAVPAVPSLHPSTSHSRLLPRIFSTAFSSRKSDDRPSTTGGKTMVQDSKKSHTQSPLTPHAAPPKLEYVKLPGTKGALMIKAVETQKKSFLAILCGENGEKVELFAGTYRTALGLSRTFILPDSPKSLELQLQGDDLVEVFLVFSQNVFGLEPATVRVREVRIGRAERRAARRRARAREIRSGQNEVFDTDPQNPDDEETGIANGINISSVGQDFPSALPSRSNSGGRRPDSYLSPGSTHEALLAHEELIALASAQIGSYTTFQQLSFTPNFPLATIADEYIIPPTYPDFLGYRAEHEPEVHGNGNVDLATIQFNPPGLPMPAPAPPSRWFYRDPRGVIHGPWKASLMQTWYKDGLLPPDLPVRKEDEKEFVLLKDLRQQCVDPVHPFRSAPPPPTVQPSPPLLDASKPLLPPISLLVQPRHFGPPPLFFSSRGGHSTSIVDARGRSVLKGRFVWSTDEVDNVRSSPRMGDVKRVEAFDVKDRSVIVALRQGGLEAMDFGDALFKPADKSRTVLPNFLASPSNTNRRGPFIWKIGTPIDSTTGGAALLLKPRTGYLGKKVSYPAGKSPSRSEFGAVGDGDAEVTEEVIFLGRKGDDLYLCERNIGAFRILKLCPDAL